jgi:hypothetical protein
MKKPAPEEQPHKLSRVRPLALDDEDERPTREDRDYGRTIFTQPPVPLPRRLKPRRMRRSN